MAAFLKAEFAGLPVGLIRAEADGLFDYEVAARLSVGDVIESAKHGQLHIIASRSNPDATYSWATLITPAALQARQAEAEARANASGGESLSDTAGAAKGGEASPPSRPGRSRRPSPPQSEINLDDASISAAPPAPGGEENPES